MPGHGVSMRRSLVLHPDLRCDAVRAIDVEIGWRRKADLAVRYAVRGDVDGLNLAPPAAPRRADELWRHTCLEAFAGDAEGEGYVEFNLSPSTAWAAYRFDRYREGMRVASAAPPRIEVARVADGLEVRAVLDLPHPVRSLGLSAVIEEACGRISYWALRHPPGRPDFHHADGFALQLPAPSAP